MFRVSIELEPTPKLTVGTNHHLRISSSIYIHMRMNKFKLCILVQIEKLKFKNGRGNVNDLPRFETG